MGEDLPQETKTLTAVTFVGALGSATRPSAKRFASGRPSERAACKHDRRRFSCRNCCRAPVASGVTTDIDQRKGAIERGRQVLRSLNPLAAVADGASRRSCPCCWSTALIRRFPASVGAGARQASDASAAWSRQRRGVMRARGIEGVGATLCPPLAGKQAGPASGRGNRAIWHGGRPRA